MQPAPSQCTPCRTAKALGAASWPVASGPPLLVCGAVAVVVVGATHFHVLGIFCVCGGLRFERGPSRATQRTTHHNNQGCQGGIFLPRRVHLGRMAEDQDCQDQGRRGGQWEGARGKRALRLALSGGLHFEHLLVVGGLGFAAVLRVVSTRQAAPC
jgi:hypothetical protein